MYIITKNYRRTFKNEVFATYDAARVFLRKLIRQRTPKQAFDRVFWRYDNPTLSDNGYSIKKVG